MPIYPLSRANLNTGGVEVSGVGKTEDTWGWEKGTWVYFVPLKDNVV